MYEITEKIELSHGVYIFKIKAPGIAKKRKAGQFVMIRTDEHGERVPFTIMDSNIEDGTITILVQEVGKSTSILCGMNKGDSILDAVGPLGHPTHIEKYGTVACIGGGIGTAPVLPIAKAMKAGGNRIISIIGARTHGLVILEKEMKEVSDELYVTTDDGSYGHHGFVTNVLKKFLEEGDTIDTVLAVGPLPMMKAVCKVTEPFKVNTIVSLNPIMVDGTGMCGACRVTIGGVNRFVCVDGPEFNGHEVDFDEIIKRNRTYFKEEKQAMEELTYHEGPRCYEEG